MGHVRCVLYVSIDYFFSSSRCIKYHYIPQSIALERSSSQKTLEENIQKSSRATEQINSSSLSWLRMTEMISFIWLLETTIFHHISYRSDSRFAPRQWEPTLLCNDVSYWLDTSRESALSYILTTLALFVDTIICFTPGHKPYAALIKSRRQNTHQLTHEDVIILTYEKNIS